MPDLLRIAAALGLLSASGAVLWLLPNPAGLCLAFALWVGVAAVMCWPKGVY